MDNEKLVVKAKRAKLGKTLLGGVQVVYPCPRCRDELTTKNDVSLGDTCPRCKTSFEFEDEIKDVFAKFEAQKKQQAEAQAAAQAEKEKIRQAKKAEQAQIAAQQFSANQAARQKEHEASRVNQKQAEQSRRQDEEKAAHDISGPWGCLIALLVVGWLGSALMILFAMDRSSQGGNGPEQAEPFFVLGVSSAVSLAVIYIFFRFLLAMHALLVAILRRLNSSAE